MVMDLDKMNTEELGKLFPVVISEPDPDWPRHFEEEKKRIEKGLGPENITGLHHIGSTAVPDLQAKPTIDILIEIPQETDMHLIVQRLKDLGYHFIPRPENPPPHMMFVKGYSEKGLEKLSFHIHVRYKNDWDEIYFRDYLRDHPEVAREYARLKLQLSEKFRNDREGYTEGKTNFITRIIQQVRNINMP
ncbi:MAG: GrpB family protein [Bacteroidales bacterium]|nr:GrpB family protein [Bacteroidales bacterium]